jgi:hypothetical protein
VTADYAGRRAAALRIPVVGADFVVDVVPREDAVLILVKFLVLLLAPHGQALGETAVTGVRLHGNVVNVPVVVGGADDVVPGAATVLGECS